MTTRPGFAPRLARAPVAATIAITARARAMRAEGIDVLSLTIGEPDFATPPHAIAAAHRAALEGHTKYPPVDGTPALKAAIIRDFQRRTGLDFAPDQVMVANGGKQVIFNALMATVSAGDEVIVPTPYWNAYPLVTGLAGGSVVLLDCPQADGFKPSAAALERALTPRTRWVVLNFPNNPTGAVLTAADLRPLADVLLAHPQCWIMADDIYARLIHDGTPHATISAVEPRLADRTLTLYGASKTYAMTGWRVGWAAGPRDLIAAMVNMQGQATSGINVPAQEAVIAALDGPDDAVLDMQQAYRRRRDLVQSALSTIPNITSHRPDGAFYVYPDISRCLGGRLETDEDFARALLDEAHVAIVHGAAFGRSPYIRISCATDDDTLARACERIADFCKTV